MSIYVYGIILVISFLVCYFSVPVSIKFAKKRGIIDNPNKDDRRVHKEPIPRAGGLAIIFSMFFTLGFYMILSMFFDEIKFDKQFIGYLIGAFLIAVMGFLDDLKDLRAIEKLLFQILAATVVYLAGTSVVGIKIPFIYNNIIDFGIFAYPITIVWIIGITNAVNLIDGLDGLAAGISSISSISLLVIFLVTGVPLEVIIITIALAGSTLGFLPYNFNPAKTFMGDVGSNFLGYTLSVISIMGLAKGYTLLAIITPIIVLGVPVLDMVFAVVRRMIRKQKLTTPDKEHIHHKLLRTGLSQKQCVLILYGITSVLGIIAVVVTLRMRWKIVLLILICINILVVAIIAKIKTNGSKLKKVIDQGE
ncbi:MAG: MraY family glycosyltransferase [Clostridia bacterium]|nr:MraY family glycosyltransferase [Clostridia bacterium]MDD4375294.1 MraY family glycosyltransferase [Clostridia bacterium]